MKGQGREGVVLRLAEDGDRLLVAGEARGLHVAFLPLRGGSVAGPP